MEPSIRVQRFKQSHRTKSREAMNESHSFPALSRLECHRWMERSGAAHTHTHTRALTGPPSATGSHSAVREPNRMWFRRRRSVHGGRQTAGEHDAHFALRHSETGSRSLAAAASGGGVLIHTPWLDRLRVLTCDDEEGRKHSIESG